MRSVRIICASLCALALSAAAASADVYPGSYSAKAAGINAKLEISKSGGGSLYYATKTMCGKSRGKIALKKSGAGLKGRKLSRGPESTLRTTVAKVELSGDGTTVVGTVKESLRGGDSKLRGCRAKRSFSAGVEQAEGFVPTRDVGHYAGTAENGLAISFDVVESGDEVEVENLAVDVQADCFDPNADDAVDIPLVTHVTGMSGQVDDDGTFFISHAPDDDTEYEFDGEIADGEASVDVIVGGAFDAAGNPSSTGPYYCDSWGDVYDAARE